MFTSEKNDGPFLNLIWFSNGKRNTKQRSSWPGFIQNIYSSEVSYEKSTVLLLQIFNHWIPLAFTQHSSLLFLKQRSLASRLLVLHLLNLFGISHIYYAKSARFYLQQMTDLEDTNPEVFQAFVNHGCHAVRPSDMFRDRGLKTEFYAKNLKLKKMKKTKENSPE